MDGRVQAKAGETKGRMVWCDREAQLVKRRQMCTEEDSNVWMSTDGFVYDYVIL